MLSPELLDQVQESAPDAIVIVAAAGGFAVARAASLNEAVREARRDPPIDVVIADYHLQKLDAGGG